MGERGFTLLEVLVAFVIAALALGVLFEGVSTGLRAVGAAGQYEQALSRARSRLDAVSEAFLRPGVQTGDDGGGYRWRTEVTPLTWVSSGETQGAQRTQLTLYHVSVVVSWGSGAQQRQVQLQSERLATSASVTLGP